MKTLTTILCILSLVSFSNAQKKITRLTEYTASNNITYKIGDKIKLGQGSGAYNEFVYVTMSGWAVSMNAEENRLGAANSGLIVRIKKIIKANTNHQKGVYFTVDGGNISNYMIIIESAIENCEIVDCIKQETTIVKVDKYSQLIKLKQLLDNGALTQEEFDSEKKKLLDNN